MKLDLCCGQFKAPGYHGVDIQFFDGVDTRADLNHSWPFKDNSIEEIYCKDGIEHLKNSIHTMNEMFRVMQPGATAFIIVPSSNGMGAFQDPTHKTFWNINSFRYFEENHPWRGQYPKMITAGFEVLSILEIRGPSDVPFVHAKLRKPYGDN